MPLPANTTTVTVVGTYLNPDGDPAEGTVTFTPSQWLQNAADNILIPAATVTKTLGTAGNFSAVLPVTDDPDLSPNNWVWDISEVIDGTSRRYSIVLPGSAATNGTVQLADIAPAAPIGPAYYSLASSLTIGSVTAEPAGSPTASITGLAPNQVLNLGIPAGAAATVAVGTVSSVASGGTASVTNSGSTSAAVLDFVLVNGPTGPQGDKGDKGDPGDLSPAGQAAAGSAIASAGSAAASAGSASTSASAAAASAGSASLAAGTAVAAAGTAVDAMGTAVAAMGSAVAASGTAVAAAGTAVAAMGTAVSAAGSATSLAAALTNIDGGAPDSNYGGIGTVDAGVIA